jgi:hypothetical protein
MVSISVVINEVATKMSVVSNNLSWHLLHFGQNSRLFLEGLRSNISEEDDDPPTRLVEGEEERILFPGVQ